MRALELEIHRNAFGFPFARVTLCCQMTSTIVPESCKRIYRPTNVGHRHFNVRECVLDSRNAALFKRILVSEELILLIPYCLNLWISHV